jgi:hypothetical protein
VSDTRRKGLKYLTKKLGHFPKERVSASKLFHPHESWTQNYTWWFNLPIDKIKELKNEKYYLLGQRNKDKFIVLKVPNIFLLKNIEGFETRYANKIILHLAAYKENWLIDERGKRRINFSKYEVKQF